MSPTRETWSPIRTSPPRRTRSQADVFHSENGSEPAPPPARHTKRPHSAGVVPSRVIRRHPDSGYHANDDEVSEVKSSKQAGSPWSGLDRPASSGSSGSLTNGHRVPSDDSSPEATLRVAVAAQAPQGSREHDEDTLCVLRLAFPPATTPTLGLPRAVSPPESEKQRYYGLVEAAISAEMVAPLSRDWKSSTHEFLDKALRQDFRETLEELDKVRPGVHSEISAAHQESCMGNRTKSRKKVDGIEPCTQVPLCGNLEDFLGIQCLASCCKSPKALSSSWKSSHCSRRLS